MNNRFITAAACCAVFAGTLSLLPALEVNQQELKSAGGQDTVTFINYNGPYARIDSAESIRNIGTGLGTPVSAAPSAPAKTGSIDRYYVIHAVDPAEKTKLDADIMLIGKNAGVDHIDNVRRIISAYLAAAYNYTQQDADTIAVFVTVYNAVYRGKLDSFTEKYKDIVTKNLSADTCGIALSYREWPGKTQIVIPLSDVNGGLSTIDTSVISDSKVVKSMQQDDGKNIDTRKQMVNIKERESDNAASNAQQKQKQAVEEQKKADTENKKAAEASKQADQTQKQAATAQKEADAANKKAAENPGDKQAQADAQQKNAEAAQKQQEADQSKQQADDQQQKADDQQKKADETKQQAADAQAKADKKQTEAQTERSEIAQDVQTMTNGAATADSVPAAYGIQLTDDKNLFSALVKVNASTGEILKQSPVSYIRNRTLYKTAGGYIAVAGENRGNGAVKIVLIDETTLEITKTGSETVADDSVLVQDDGDFYCVIKDGNSWTVARYGADLVMKYKSDTAVKSGTPITATGDSFIVTGQDGAVCILEKADLKKRTASKAN